MDPATSRPLTDARGDRNERITPRASTPSRPFALFANTDLGWSGAALVLFFCAVVPVLMVFGRRYAGHNADSVLPAIISLKNVTWYYWEENRFGNFIPFLTQWIPYIRLNFMAQIYLRCAFGFVAILSALELLRLAPGRLLAEQFAASVLLIFAAAQGGFLSTMWWAAQPYGTSLALLYPALLIITGKAARPLETTFRYAAGLVFFWLSFFVDLALPIFLLPLFFLRLLRTRERADLERLLLGSLATAAAFGHAQLFRPRTSTGLILTADPLARGLEASLGQMNLTLVAVVAGLAFILSRVAPRHLQDVPAPSVLKSTAIAEVALASLFFIAFAASTEWVAINRMLGRYFAIPILMGVVIVSSSVTLSVFRDFPQLFRWRRGISLLLACLAGLAVWLTQGGVAAVRAYAVVNGHVFAASEYLETIDLPRGQPIIVDGDYWRAWPVVYAIMAARPNNRQVYGLAFRWQPEGPQLRRMLATHRSIVLLCLQNEVADCVRDLRALIPANTGVVARTASQGKDPGGGPFAVEEVRLAHPR